MRVTPEERAYDVRGLRLVYYTWGAADAPPLLFLHGFADHGRSFAASAERLDGEYFVVAPDLRGHGKSGWIGAGGFYHFYDYYGDVIRLLDLLKLNDVTMVGHSMGGSVATAVCSMIGERVSSLVLLEGMGPPASDLRDSPTRLRRWFTGTFEGSTDGDIEARRRARRSMRDLSAAADRLRAFNPRLAEPRALELAEAATERAEDGGRVWRQDPLHRTPAAKPFILEEARAIWSALRMPVLSLFGAESPFRPDRLDERHAEIERVRVASLLEAGHNLHHDRPEVVARAIARFARDPEADLGPGVRPGLLTPE